MVSERQAVKRVKSCEKNCRKVLSVTLKSLQFASLMMKNVLLYLNNLFDFREAIDAPNSPYEIAPPYKLKVQVPPPHT